MTKKIENKFLVVGVTGGMGSGKTAAAKFVAEKGHKVIFTDDRAKELMAGDEKLRAKLIKEFGPETYHDDGGLNKEYIAAKVFGPGCEDALAKLESIVHPAVIDDMIELVDRCEADGGECVFIESALIYEAGLEDGFDYVVVVDSTAENCLERTMLRGGIDSDEAQRRIARQIPLPEKMANADFVIQNNGSIEDLKKAVNFIIGIVLQLPPRRALEKN